MVAVEVSGVVMMVLRRIMYGVNARDTRLRMTLVSN